MPKPSGSLLAVIAVPLVLLLLATATIAFYSSRALEDSRHLVTLTNQIVEETQRVLILAQDAETGQRGYILTGEDTYLQPYENAQNRLPDVIENLKTLLSDNPAQLQRLQTLNGYIQVKLAELTQTVELRRSKGLEAAMEVVRTNTGQAAMTSIRNIVRDMLIAERTLLDQRMNSAKKAEDETFLITASLFVVLLLVSSGGGVIFLRNFGRLARAESELEVKAGLLQATLDTVAEGIAAFDKNNKLVASNSRFFDLFNFPYSLGARSSVLDDFIAYDKENGGKFAEIAYPASDDTRPLHAIQENAENKTLEVYRNAMTQGGAVFTARDITEAVHAENALRQAQKMESVGQLTGGIAHDFNNLLQIVLANLDLALRKVKEPDIQKRLRDAVIGAERGSKLTRQLLAFARRQPLKPETVNLARLVRDLTEFLRRTLGEEIEIEETIAAGLWSALADRSQIENAIVNLCINARDAMPNGGRLTIEMSNAHLDEAYARLHDDVRPGQYVMIGVTDTGIGMSRETLAKAFDPFFSTKAEGHGTGLGLSMVYGFAKQSGGHIKIYSELGIGTTIRVYLPRSIQAETPISPQSAEASASKGEVILVVEDDNDVRGAVLSILADLGYRTIEAVNGDETLAILRTGEHIDLMFTDVVMPGEFHGRKLAKAALELRPELKILFTSGYTENSIIHHGRLDDGVNLISKPYRKEDLARRVRHILDEPVQLPAATGVEEPNAASDAPRLSVFEAGRKVKIVFVEDDALVRIATIDMLEDIGLTVFASADSDSAMALLQQERPDIFMVDVSLGKNDGRTLAEEARQLLPSLRIVFATGRDPGDLKSRIPDAQVITKPYGLGELQSLLSSVS